MKTHRWELQNKQMEAILYRIHSFLMQDVMNVVSLPILKNAMDMFTKEELSKTC